VIPNVDNFKWIGFINSLLNTDLGTFESSTTDIKDIEEREKSLPWVLKGLVC